LSSYRILILLFALGCPNVDGGMRAGTFEVDDAPQPDIESDAGALEPDYSSSEDVISVCTKHIETPDGGFQNEIGIVKSQRRGQRLTVTVTVTLFDDSCGMTEFNLLMEEKENNTVLNTTVSPVNLSNEPPLTRCYCDMNVAAVYVDEDESLKKVSAYFYSEVVSDNGDAIPGNGFIGEISL